MKLISRKAAIAAITAAAVTAGTMTAPAMAEGSSDIVSGSSDIFSGLSSTSDDKKSETTPKSGAPSTTKSEEAEAGSSLKDPKGRENLGKNLKEWLTLLTTIGSLLGALYTIGNNIDRLSRQGR